MTICSVRMYNIYLWEHPFLAHWSTAAEALKEPAAIKNLWKIILIFYSLALFATHLEENALLELEVLPHDVGDIGRLDRERDGYVRLFKDVVNLHYIMVVCNPKPRNLDGGVGVTMLSP